MSLIFVHFICYFLYKTRTILFGQGEELGFYITVSDFKQKKRYELNSDKKGICLYICPLKKFPCINCIKFGKKSCTFFQSKNILRLRTKISSYKVFHLNHIFYHNSPGCQKHWNFFNIRLVERDLLFLNIW